MKTLLGVLDGRIDYELRGEGMNADGFYLEGLVLATDPQEGKLKWKP